MRRKGWVGAAWLGITIVSVACTSEPPKLTAVYYDPYLTNEPEESFRLRNGLTTDADISGWIATDGEGSATFPSGATIPAGKSIWVARQATAFRSEFGFAPDWEYAADTDPTVPNLTLTGAFSLANTGDDLRLTDASAVVQDAVVWEAGDTATLGWSGAALQPYDNNNLGIEGQILYRKLDELSGIPVPDTDTAEDWAQSRGDIINGRKVQYPGWDLEHFFQTPKAVQPSTITVGVAPDSAYEQVLALMQSAASSIHLAVYTFTSAPLADALAAQALAGVEVRVLLEGEPAGGIDDQELWVAQQIENAGGEVWFLFTDDSIDVHDRYDYYHAKYMIVDSTRALVASENFGGSGMPSDDKSDGTSGNRGAYVVTDSPTMVAHLADVFARDLDPVSHRDVTRWGVGGQYGPPPAGFVPSYGSGGTVYPVAYPNPVTVTATIAQEMVQSPETSLRDHDALLGMVKQAAAGDEVRVEQLNEDAWWGASASNAIDDPNPRLEAYIAAARRGAKVRLLLDSFYDSPTDPRGNRATCRYANGIDLAESLDLECRVGAPTGLGIHNKMVLVKAGTSYKLHVGSLNGSEQSNKGNREMAIQVQNRTAHDFLAGVFDADFSIGTIP